MIIAGFVLLAILLALACWYPPIAVFTLALSSISGDGFGINNYLRVIGLQTLANGITGPVAVGSFICCYRILMDPKREFGPRAKSLVVVILAITIWIPFSVLAKGGSLSFAIGSLTYTGILVAPITIAYARQRLARALFVGFILTQLSLAALVVLVPNSPARVLGGTQYQSGLGDIAGISQAFSGQVSRASDQPRMFAQFNDPNTYGLYAVAGAAIGFFLLMRGGPLSRRAVGIAMISLAVFGWIATFSRGATLGLVIGVFLVMGGQVFSRRLTTGCALAVTVVVLGILAFATINASSFQHAAESLSSVSITSSDVETRADALHVGWQEFASNPVFGVPLDFVWPHDIPPHQLPFYFAAQYGILPGLLVCLLLWAVFGSTRRFLFSRISLGAQWDFALAVVLGWILLGTAVTNNLSAPILFWVLWGIAADPWLAEPGPAAFDASMRRQITRHNLQGRPGPSVPAKGSAG